MNRGQLLCGLRVEPPCDNLGAVPAGCFLLWEWSGPRRPLLVATNTEHDELRSYLLWAGLTVRQVDDLVGASPAGRCRLYVALRLIDYFRTRQTRRTA